MSRRMMGDVQFEIRYPCGKVVKKTERDAIKYKQMHKKVCQTCREAPEFDTSRRQAGVGLGITRNGNVERRDPNDPLLQLQEMHK